MQEPCPHCRQTNYYDKRLRVMVDRDGDVMMECEEQVPVNAYDGDNNCNPAKMMPRIRTEYKE